MTLTTDPGVASRPKRSPQLWGWLAVAAAIVGFSLGSTLVKRAEAPGIMIAFWRLLFTTIAWNLVLVATGRRPSWANAKQALLPGVFFGLNLSAFFIGATNNTIAAAELIGATSPFLIVPLGAKLFDEHINPKALLFAIVAFGGVGIVLLSAPAAGETSTFGHVMCALAVLCWTGYVTSTRKFRQQLDVVQFMAAMMPIATLTASPIALASGDFGGLPSNAWKYVAMLTVITGLGSHGLIVFAQRSVPIGSIGVAQVTQPALAVVWGFLLLSESLVGWQVVGMVMMLAGLVSFVTFNTRSARRMAVARPLWQRPL